MPRVRPPQPDAGQVHLLTTSLITATGADGSTGHSYLPALLVADITAFLNDRQENGVTVPAYAPHVASRAIHEGRVTRETGESQLAEADLETQLRPTDSEALEGGNVCYSELTTKNLIYCLQVIVLMISCLSCGPQHLSSLMAANAVSAGQQIKPKLMAQLGKPVIFQMEFVVRTRHGVEKRTELIQGVLKGFEPSGGSVGAIYATTYEHGGTGIFRSEGRRLELNSVVPAGLGMGNEGQYRILSGEAFTARIYFPDGTIKKISHRELRRPESLMRYGFQLISWEHHRISGKTII